MLATAPSSRSAMPTTTTDDAILPNPRYATPRRVPKLAVRNRVPDGPTVNETSHSSDDSTPRYHERSAESQPRPRQPTKRKSAGVLGFFMLKEPSTSALEEFAEHEKKKAAQKSTQSNAGVVNGVSTQRLPNHVPKVNSKWNGLPKADKSKRESLDYREKYAEMGASKRNSAASSLYHGYGDSGRQLFGSLSSKPSIRQSPDKKRASVISKDANSWRSESPVDPALTADIALPTFRESLFCPSAMPHHSGSGSPPELEYSESLHPPQLVYSNGGVTSPEASPKTPALELALPRVDSDVRLSSPGLYGLRDDSGAFYFSDSDEVVVKTAGPGILGRPAASLRKDSDRSASIQSTTSNSAFGRGIEHSTSIQRSAAPVVRNFSHVSKFCSRGSSTSRYSGSTPPTTASTTAAKTRATSRSPIRYAADLVYPGTNGQPVRRISPPKEQPRLPPKSGKKDDVLPWEAFEPPTEVANSHNDSKKPKRLSYMLGKK